MKSGRRISLGSLVVLPAVMVMLLPAVTGASSTTTALPPAGLSVPVNVVAEGGGQQQVPAVETGAKAVLVMTIVPTDTATQPSTTVTNWYFNAVESFSPVAISYKLDVAGMADITAARVHLGATGTNGDIVVDLLKGAARNGAFTGTLAQGTMTDSDLLGPYEGKTLEDLLAAILAGNVYVNVSSVAHPAGEVRAQLAVSGASASTTTSTAVVTTSTSGTVTTGTSVTSPYWGPYQ